MSFFSPIDLHPVLVSKLNTIDGFHDVPSADSAANSYIRDVLGSKLDTHDGDSVYAFLHILDEHAHHISMVYPYLADPVLLTKAAGAWAALPTPTEIVPANTITSDFDLHNIKVSQISAAGEYIIALYQGGAGAETLISAKPFSRTSVNAQEGQIKTGTPIIAANTRISAAISSSNAAADTARVKVEYHLY